MNPQILMAAMVLGGFGLLCAGLMANEFARNIQDANLLATFTLPTTVSYASGKFSSAMDLGAESFRPERLELELSYPGLTNTMAPSTATAGAFFFIEASTTSTFAAVARTITFRNLVGTGSGTLAGLLRARLPSDCERYIRFGIYLGTTCADASTLTATGTVRF